jgi:hypothetical protein
VKRRLHVLLFFRPTESLDLKRRLLLQHVLPVELGHLLVVPRILVVLAVRAVLPCGLLKSDTTRIVLLLARLQLFLARVLRDAQFVEVGLGAGADRFVI